MVVDGVPDVITMTPEQLHPVPELSSVIGSDNLLAIEKPMTSAGMGLVAETTHWPSRFPDSKKSPS